MRTQAVCAFLFVAVCLNVAVANLQSWSIQTKYGVDHTFTCNATYNAGFEVTENDTIKVQWKKHGHDEPLKNTSDHYEFTELHGIYDFQLTIKKIDGSKGGIYVCEVMFHNGTMLGTVVKGLNIGGHEYEDQWDKYEDNFVVGVIAGASVFVLLVGVGLIENFRYLTSEQKQKRREREDERVEKEKRWETSGHINTAADLDMTEDGKKSIDATANGDHREVNTHL